MSARDQANEVLKRLPQGPVIGAEIGVQTGKMSRILLERADLDLYMVDSWIAMPRYRITQEQQDKFKRMAKEACPRGRILHMTSLEAANEVQDGTLDFVFIDADHSYDGVRADILAWKPKLKASGLMGGHDYANPGERFGLEVKRAVDEFGNVELGGDTTWFYR